MIDKNKLKEQWVNDHLDLYCFAKKIDDQEWQREILKKLSNINTFVTKEIQEIAQHELSKAFDITNEQLGIIYKKLSNCSSKDKRAALYEQAWHLKLKRMSLIHQLHALSSGANEQLFSN